MGSHQSARMKNDEWLTPRWILDALGRFDLDPCAPVKRPWPTASRHMMKNFDGLKRAWNGRVWLNPPFGREWPKWVEKLAAHGDGVALLAARTETRPFFDLVWRRAHGLLFLKGRPHFCFVDGTPAKANCGCPIVLVAYGEENASALRLTMLEGHYVELCPEIVSSAPTPDRGAGK